MLTPFNGFLYKRLFSHYKLRSLQEVITSLKMQYFFYKTETVSIVTFITSRKGAIKAIQPTAIKSRRTTKTKTRNQLSQLR